MLIFNLYNANYILTMGFDMPPVTASKIEWNAQVLLAERTRHGNGRRRRLLAVSSGGGHWVQLLRVSSAFSDCDVTFVTVHELYRAQVVGHQFYTVNDATRWNKFGLVKMALKLGWIIWKQKPEVVVSTGAAPGYVAIRLARLIGARTIWLDSLANIEQISMSAQKIGRHADLWLTQWAHLAKPEGPHYAGSVL